MENEYSVKKILGIAVVVLIVGGLLIGFGMILKTVTWDASQYENKARRDLKKLDDQYDSLETGPYDTNEQHNIVVWNRKDGTECQSKYIDGELLYPPLDCYIVSYHGYSRRR